MSFNKYIYHYIYLIINELSIFFDAASMKKCMKISLENADKANKYFSKIDQLIYPHIPLTWMFIRPPWANPGGDRKCLKECLLMKLEADCASEKVCTVVLFSEQNILHKRKARSLVAIHTRSVLIFDLRYPRALSNTSVSWSFNQLS